MNPCSPYAIAKLAAHKSVQLYRKAYGLFASNGILFNHESERRGEQFVTRKITLYVGSCIRARMNHEPMPDPLRLGNLEARRDWTHAADMVRGMWMILNHTKADDFVLGSGETRSIKDFLEVAFGYANLNWEDHVVVDPKFYRPTDVNLLQADCAYAKCELGWEPHISFQDMVERMIKADVCPGVRCHD